MVLPTRFSRKEALARVAGLVQAAKASSISVYGPDDRDSRVFAQDLAGLFNGSLAEPEPGLDSSHKEGEMKEQLCILLSSSPTSRPFKLLLQANPVLLDKLDAVLDISAPERPTLLHPHASTFSLNPFRYRLKQRRIPIARYAVQVLLFLLISLLNNAAFAYHVPMAVHIIFRSGGLVVNMLMGWAFEKRR